MAKYAAALDQGTTSTRCMIFDHGGQRGQRRPEGARADLSEARAGSSTTRRRSGRAPRRWSTRRWQEAGAGAERHRRRGHHQPARDDCSSGTRRTGEPLHNAIVWQDTRTDELCDEYSRRRRPGPLPGEDRAAAGDLLLGPEDPLDPRQRRRRARTGRGRRPAVRHHGHLADLEPHRRPGRRPAHHRRDQRQPHDADGPRHAGVGRRDRWT